MKLRIATSAAVLLFSLAACASRAVAVPEARVAAIMNCLEKNTCRLPVQDSEIAYDQTARIIHVVTGYDEDVIYRYFYTDQGHFGVILIHADKAIVLEDDDRDGRVDHVIRSSGCCLLHEAALSRFDRDYTTYQEAYYAAMDAGKALIPALRGPNERHI